MTRRTLTEAPKRPHLDALIERSARTRYVIRLTTDGKYIRNMETLSVTMFIGSAQKFHTRERAEFLATKYLSNWEVVSCES